MKSRTRITLIVGIALGLTTVANAATFFDANVNPGIIFGSGNANGSFTVDRTGGLEFGLRAKLRHDATGQPQNVFNSNGDGTYTFNPGVAPTQSFPTAEWSFEWTINTDFVPSNPTGWDLDDLTYQLAMTSNVTVSMPAFDPINDVNPGNGQVLWDHSVGDNSTTDATDLVAGTEVQYLATIAANNVAQQSWKPHWVVPSVNPAVVPDHTNAAITSVPSVGAIVVAAQRPKGAVDVPRSPWIGP